MSSLNLSRRLYGLALLISFLGIYFPLEVITVAVTFAFILAKVPDGAPLATHLTIVLALFAAAGIARGIYWARKEAELEARIGRLNDMLTTAYQLGNPWNLQTRLMLVSNQQVASAPELNKTGLLYVALICEELAEMMATYRRILDRVETNDGQAFGPTKDRMHHGSYVIANLSITLREAIRDYVPHNLAIPLMREEARALLDDVTDNAVVVCGAAMAAGMPAAAAYVRVTDSNLSKANPVTGVIDKLPDGKWIKGANYREPELDALLDPFYAS